MADKSVRVVLSASTSGFVAEVRRAGAAVREVNAEMGKASQTQAWRGASTALIGLGAAAVGAAGLAVKAFATFDAQMSAVKATGAEAAGSIDELRAAALKAGADTKYSATEAAAGIESLLKAGVSVSDVLGGGLDGALSLAASGNLNVADSAEVAATAMTQFGLSGNKVGHIADLLAAGAGKAQGEVSDLAAALKQSGLVAAGAGLSIEETTGTLAAFASAGLIGSDAGTSFKTMLQRLQNPSKEAATAMRELGINAYDAQGNFVSMADLAGQLQGSMKDLAPAQRDAALATIFGSDAIRAANVLYQQGAEGISRWTKEVNEAGFAQRMAGEKMNNLKGDLKQLGGSIETLMVRAGEGANGPLRSLVQQMTEFVNLLGRHQGAAQAILGITAGLGGLALTVGGVMKVVTAVSEFRAALSSLEAVAPKLTGAAKGLAAFAGGATVAIAAGLALAHAADSNIRPAITNVSDEVVKLGRAVEAGKSINFNAFFQDTDALGNEADGVHNLAEAYDRLFNRTSGQKFNDSVSSVISSVTGLKGTADITRDSLGRLDQTLVGMKADQATAVFRQITDTLTRQGATTEQIAQMFPEYTKKVQDAAAANGQAVTGVEALKNSLDKSQASAASAAEGHKALADAIRASQNAALAASGSMIGYEAAVDAATEAVKKNGRNLDIGTEAGRNNRKALDDVASSATTMRDAMIQNGAGTAEVTAKTQAARAEFLRVADAMGMDATKANELANQYGLIPGAVQTLVTAPGAVNSKMDVAGFLNALNQVPPNKRTEVLSAFDRGGVSAAIAALQSVPESKTVTITTINRTIYQQYGSTGMTMMEANGGVVDFYANGGFSRRENHVAQIAPAGAWRMWAEPETGGEAYIPLSVNKRKRSLDIWRETGRRLGVTGFAEGGFHTAPSYVSPQVNVGGTSTTVYVTSPVTGEWVRAEARVVVQDEVNSLAVAQSRARL